MIQKSFFKSPDLLTLISRKIWVGEKYCVQEISDFLVKTFCENTYIKAMVDKSGQVSTFGGVHHMILNNSNQCPERKIEKIP